MLLTSPLRPRLVVGILLSLLPLAARPAEPGATSPAQLTAEDFFRPPAARGGQLNPAGTHLAVMVYDLKTDSTGLKIIDLGTRTFSALTGTKVFDLYDFDWVGNDRVVFTVARDNLYASGLYIVNRDLKR